MQELISRTALGDRKALGLLYEANAGLIHKVAVGYSAMCERDIAVAVGDGVEGTVAQLWQHYPEKLTV